MTREINHVIGGTLTKGSPVGVSPIFNPAFGTQIREVPLASNEDLLATVESAKSAFPKWAATPVARRARHMFKLYDLLHAHMDEIATALVEEHGKTFEDAKGEIMRGIEIVEFAAGMPYHLEGRMSEQVATGVDQYSVNQPLGVTAGITPFNFPAMIPLWMLPMSITAGNTFILKPSERDPMVPQIILELIKEAGIPDGVVNLLHGDKSTVDGLLEHPDVKAISFVGSTAVGRYIHAKGSSHGKRVQAMCGAKNHMIVLPDADMDAAADALLASGFGAAGERCMAISAAIPVGAETAEALKERLIPKVRALQIGNGMDPATEMGPVINAAAKERIESYINRGIEEGADLLVDGRGLSLQGMEAGFFLGGTLFDKVDPSMSIYRDEIFGPVLSMVRQDTYEDAVALATNHAYGNGTALFTRDGGLARRFVNEVQVGMIGINVPIPVPTAWSSFGGWKDSFFGDIPMYGPDGLKFWIKRKNVMTRWPSTDTRTMNSFNFGAAAG